LPSTLAALAGLDETPSPVLVVNAGLGSVTTAIVQAGVLLLHRSVDMGAGTNTPVELVGSALPLVDRESSVQEWARQEPLGPEGWDQFDVPSAMPSVLNSALVREIEAQATAREVAQAVSVAAAYFEDSLQSAPEQLLIAGTLDVGTLTTAAEENGLEGLRVREMMDTGMMEAGAVTASVPRGWLAGVRGALRN